MWCCRYYRYKQMRKATISFISFREFWICFLGCVEWWYSGKESIQIPNCRSVGKWCSRKIGNFWISDKKIFALYIYIEGHWFWETYRKYWPQVTRNIGYATHFRNHKEGCQNMSISNLRGYGTVQEIIKDRNAS